MKKYLMILFATLAVGFQACNDNDDLWDAIDDLKGRVQALEKQVDALNGNIEALQQLYNGATISSVTSSDDGTYTIVLSDGRTITLEQGSEAKAVIPIIGIGADGFWQVSYDNGATFQKLGVKAEAQDGMTPKFRIDEMTGYWQISTDGGKSYDDVRDTAGNPVKAVDQSKVTDKFFSDVRVDGDEFYILMKDGGELRIPIVKDFYCRIVDDAGEVFTEVQKFEAGAAKQFRVEIKGADGTVVTAPDGWSARLSDIVEHVAILTVTAPEADMRAAADNTKDVTILATSNKYSGMAKIQVESSGAAPTPPAISVVALSSSSETLTFEVTVSANTDVWKYICLKSSEQAPADAQAVIDRGTAVAGTDVTVSGLEPDTEYTIYVAAVSAGGLLSELAKASAVTASDPDDWYSAGVTIDGVTYKKGDPGVELLTVDASTTADVPLKPLSTARIYFLDEQVEDSAYSFVIASGASVVSDVVVIGRYKGKKPRVKVAANAYWGLKSASGNENVKLIFKNLELDLSARANYLTNNNNANAGGEHFGTLALEDCTVTNISKPLFSVASNSLAYGIRNIRLENNTFRIAAPGLQLFNLGATTRLDAYKNIVIRNNVFYGDRAAAAYQGQLVNYSNGTPQAGTDWTLEVFVTGNTFVNFVGKNVYVKLSTAQRLDMSKNLFYALQSNADASVLYGFFGDDTSSPVASPAVTLDNKFYGGTGSYNDYHDNSTVKIGEKGHVQESDLPLTLDFANGVFTSRVFGYGAVLE